MVDEVAECALLDCPSDTKPHRIRQQKFIHPYKLCLHLSNYHASNVAKYQQHGSR